MEHDVIALLQDPDPTRRKEGVIKAGKSRDAAYLAALRQISTRDPEDGMRRLAQKAIEHIEKHAALKAQSAGAAAPTVAELRQVDTRGAPARRWSPLRMALLGIFTLVVIGAAGVLVWVVAGSRADQWHQTTAARFNDAAPLPDDGSSDDARLTLTGAVYHTRVNRLMSFYVQEPTGTAPPAGWPVVVALHGWTGEAMHMLVPFGPGALQHDAILVVPDFDHSGNVRYEDVFAALNTMLSHLSRHYPIDAGASIITGFSWGGRVAQFYTADYPEVFAGAVVGGCREYRLPAGRSDVVYAVFIGANDHYADVNRPALARQFAEQMAARGMPLWYLEVTPGVGHVMTSGQITRTWELIDHLRSS